MIAYLSAPLFSQSQRRWNREFSQAVIAAWRDADFDPLEFVLPQDFPPPPKRDSKHKTTFERCVEAIDRADAVVVVTSGVRLSQDGTD